eukprot:1698437-Pleurochrysis_carterae.AAC.1
MENRSRRRSRRRHSKPRQGPRPPRPARRPTPSGRAGQSSCEMRWHRSEQIVHDLTNEYEFRANGNFKHLS